MLKELLQSVNNQKGSLSLVDLSEEFNITIPMVEQMLITLIRAGKLQEIQPPLGDNCTSCKACPLNDSCDLTNIFQEKQILIVN